jgi:hypothetical protein
MPDPVTHKPVVWLVGDIDYPDFTESTALLRSTADVGNKPPELIVMAQSRPGVFIGRNVERLRRSVPLAGIVALAGSWCEGETRTGRPISGVLRLYWYEFPNWWSRQLALLSAGRCPDWARREESGPPSLNWISNSGLRRSRNRKSGCEPKKPLIAIKTPRWDTAEAISDVLEAGNFESIWIRFGCNDLRLDRVDGGIWEGGQLDHRELDRLAAFCASLAPRKSPVVALLDFPRHDRCEAAREIGAEAVLGKPWRNVDLITTLRNAIDKRAVLHAA